MTVGQSALRVSGQRMERTDLALPLVTDLHERRGRELFGFARHLGLTDEAAQDAVQESVTRLWQTLRRGEPIENPDAWVFRTLYRVCMDEHRWRRRWQQLGERLRPAVREHASNDRTDLIAVWDAVEQLPERQRLVVYLRYRADLPFEEIGRILGIEAVSARSQVSRALDTLRERLGDETETTS
jgi:RNA polymerase sigma-70 factor (ECF subfamily)